MELTAKLREHIQWLERNRWQEGELDLEAVALSELLKEAADRIEGQALLLTTTFNVL